MPAVIGLDHIYIAVRDLGRAELFYDGLLQQVLGFQKKTFVLAGEPHIQYFNRHFGYVLRPAHTLVAHDPYAPGLHHFCLRVDSIADVQETARQLGALGLVCSAPQCYPEYAPDYWAIFLSDPDGIRLEITNYRQERRARYAQSPA